MDAKQVDFFETFGFCKFPGLLQADIAEVIGAFEEVFHAYKDKMAGARMIAPFIDHHERLIALLTDARIASILTALVGEDYNYMGSDGNYYSGNTPWHPDGRDQRRHIKIAFYLDPLHADNGALRVIPGSHLHEDRFAGELLAKLKESERNWAVAGQHIPAVALDVVPGDVLVFDHNLQHSSWGGSQSRRMFTINACQHYEDAAAFQSYLALHRTYQNTSRQYYGDLLLQQDHPLLRKHLQQVLANSAHLPELELGE